MTDQKKKAWHGGIGIIEADDNTHCTASGSGMTIRHRAAPLDTTPPTLEEMLRPAEAWALDVLKRAGLAADGVADGTADTQENYAQRFIHYGKRIRDKIKCGDAAGAVADALVLGGFIRESQLKFKWEMHVEKYDVIKQVNKDKGHRGAEVRWGSDDRSGLNEILQRLAKKRDDWGHTNPAELWPMLLGELDVAGANPVENAYKKLLDAVVIYGNDRNEFSFEAFRKQIGRIRNGGT